MRDFHFQKLPLKRFFFVEELKLFSNLIQEMKTHPIKSSLFFYEEQLKNHKSQFNYIQSDYKRIDNYALARTGKHKAEIERKIEKCSENRKKIQNLLCVLIYI